MTITATNPSDKLVRTGPLSHGDIIRWLDRLDHDDSAKNGPRDARRYGYRIPRLRVTSAKQASTSPTSRMVASRWISSKAVGVLDTTYCYIGTSVTVTLITPYGSWQDVPGKIHSCTYVAPSIHDVEIRFDQPIEPAEFSRSAVCAAVLVVEDDAFMAQLITKHLERENAVVTRAGDGATALELIRTQEFDLVLMDLNMPVMDGMEAIRVLRSDGYEGTVIALSAMDPPHVVAACLEAGFNSFSRKPISPQTIKSVLQGLSAEPIVSSLDCDAELNEIITSFMATLPATGTALLASVQAGNLDEFRISLQSLANQLACLGFQGLADRTMQLHSRIAGEPLEAVRSHLRGLLRQCRRIRPRKQTAA